MNEQYDKSIESIFIEYEDANNLYGAAQNKTLPCGNFKCSSTEIYVLNIPDNAHRAYILEEDSNYAKELHDYHSDFPLAPENQNLPKLLSTLVG